MSSQHRQTSSRSVLLHERARVMRAAPTLSEARLWAHLSGSQLGVAFRRQVVLGEYIVDFVALACCATATWNVSDVAEHDQPCLRGT